MGGDQGNGRRLRSPIYSEVQRVFGTRRLARSLTQTKLAFASYESHNHGPSAALGGGASIPHSQESLRCTAVLRSFSCSPPALARAHSSPKPRKSPSRATPPSSRTPS